MPAGISDDSSSATPAAAPPVNRPRSPAGARPNMPRTTVATTNAANSAKSQSLPEPSPVVDRCVLTGAGSDSPSISFTSTAVASVTPPA